MVKERNSNIELLRIIAILMVVISHYSVHNGIDNSLLSLGVNRFLLEIVSLGNIGVILFVMITGYFMSESKKGIRLSKLLTLYFHVLFYSLGLYLIFVIFGYEVFSFKGLIKCMFPFVFHQYWFVTVYIILYILSPYINKLLSVLSRSDNIKFLVILMFMFSFLPTFTTLNFYGNELIQFVLFYSLGAYFRKYSDNIFTKSKKFNYLVLIGSVILLLSSVIIIDILQVKYGFSFVSSTYFFNRNSMVAIIFAISLFNLFVNKNVYSSKVINTYSSLVFGIYLLSDHNIVRRFLWIDLFHNMDYVSSNYFVLHFLMCICIVFVICGFIEFIRKMTLEKLIVKIFKEKDGVSFDDRVRLFIDSKLKKVK